LQGDDDELADVRQVFEATKAIHEVEEAKVKALRCVSSQLGCPMRTMRANHKLLLCVASKFMMAVRCRNNMALYNHVAPISWYEDASEKRACGELGLPGALQVVDISYDSKFDIVQEMWKKLDEEL
jgi:hypothetical protein